MCIRDRHSRAGPFDDHGQGLPGGGPDLRGHFAPQGHRNPGDLDDRVAGLQAGRDRRRLGVPDDAVSHRLGDGGRCLRNALGDLSLIHI